MNTAVDWRRDLHRHPELGFTEFRTASRAPTHPGGLCVPLVGSDAPRAGTTGTWEWLWSSRSG
jgi:hypothetical protein